MRNECGSLLFKQLAPKLYLFSLDSLAGDL